MSLNWQNWCRLCGSSNSTMKIESSSEIEQLMEKILDVVFFCLREVCEKILIFLIFQIPTFDLKICNDCLYTFNEVQCIIAKSKSIQNMFLELLDDSKTEEFNYIFLNEMRTKFGLKEICVEAEEEDSTDLSKILLKQEMEVAEMDVDSEYCLYQQILRF